MAQFFMRLVVQNMSKKILVETYRNKFAPNRKMYIVNMYTDQKDPNRQPFQNHNY